MLSLLAIFYGESWASLMHQFLFSKYSK